jgi:hypothetical protein
MKNASGATIISNGQLVDGTGARPVCLTRKENMNQPNKLRINYDMTSGAAEFLADATVKVIHGPNDGQFAVAGAKVGSVQTSLRDAFSEGADAGGRLRGRREFRRREGTVSVYEWAPVSRQPRRWRDDDEDWLDQEEDDDLFDDDEI